MSGNDSEPSITSSRCTCVDMSTGLPKTRGTPESTNFHKVAHPAFTTSRQPGTMRPRYSRATFPWLLLKLVVGSDMTMWCRFCEHEEYESHRAVEPSTHISEKSLGRQAVLWARMRVCAGSP